MKILVVGDVHWSQYSSIVRKRGNKYSLRLENLIQSINWAENLADECDVDEILYLGDFFDKPELNAEELSALSDINWSPKLHEFLVGNHEIIRNDLEFNSTNLFNLANFYVIDKVSAASYASSKIQIVYLPYIPESKRKPLSEYFTKNNKTTIVFSHNDIKGFQMGNFISQEGFDIVDIDKNCDLYLNGHLHNGGRITNKIINVGNLTGQNFSEDAFKYDHSVIVLDTDNCTCAVYENPYAMNFYKIDFSGDKGEIDNINKTSLSMKRNCVATIKCNEEDLKYLRARFDPNVHDDFIPSNCNMIETRFIVQLSNTNEENKVDEDIVAVDHIKQFSDYMINLLGRSDILMQELSEVCK